jgi:hypothetical protein
MGVACADIIAGGMTPQAAAEKAFKRIEEIFAKYPISQSWARPGVNSFAMIFGRFVWIRPRRRRRLWR